MVKYYLDDLKVGQRFELGSFSVSAADIVAFAERYDPQPFHLVDDPAGPFGGLVASGWQTGSLCQALLVKGFLSDMASLGSPGLEQVRFLKPVRPNTVYAASFTVHSITPSRSRPDRGRILGRLLLQDPEETPVYTLDGLMMFARREPQSVE